MQRRSRTFGTRCSKVGARDTECSAAPPSTPSTTAVSADKDNAIRMARHADRVPSCPGMGSHVARLSPRAGEVRGQMMFEIAKDVFAFIGFATLCCGALWRSLGFFEFLGDRKSHRPGRRRVDSNRRRSQRPRPCDPRSPLTRLRRFLTSRTDAARIAPHCGAASAPLRLGSRRSQTRCGYSLAVGVGALTRMKMVWLRVSRSLEQLDPALADPSKRIFQLRRSATGSSSKGVATRKAASLFTGAGPGGRRAGAVDVVRGIPRSP